MQISRITVGLSLAAAASAASTVLQLDNSSYDVVENVPFNITWSGASADITLILVNGDPLNLQPYATIASGLSGSYYVWTPSASLPTDTYALEIEAPGQDPNYSPQFQYVGAAVASSSSSGSATASSTSAKSSTSGLSTTTVTASSTTITSTSASSTTTTASNSTSSTSTSASTTHSSTTSSASSSSTSTVPKANSAAEVASPLAFVFLAGAALLALN